MMSQIQAKIKGLDRRIRICLILLIIALTLYSPLELTRVILIWSKQYPAPFQRDFYFEIPFIWLTYIAAMLIVAAKVKRR